LSGTTTVAATNGVATFAGLSIDKAAAGYALAGSSGALTGAASSLFNVTASTVSAAQSTVSASSPIIASSGSSQSTIIVTARDQFGNAIQGATVVITATGGGNAVTQPVGTTDASGVATGTLSSPAAGSKTVSATINTVGVTQTATVAVSAGAVSAAQSTVTATSPIAAGSGNSAITVTARDQFANPIQGATVTLTATPTPGNTLTQPLGTTDAGGVATGSMTRTAAGLHAVSSPINAVATTQTATAVLNAVSLHDALPIFTATSPIAAGSGTSTITVTARDECANPIQGATVTLAATPTAGNTVTQPLGTTDAGGVVTGTLSSTAAGSKRAAARSVGVAMTKTTTEVVNAGQVSAEQSTAAT